MEGCIPGEVSERLHSVGEALKQLKLKLKNKSEGNEANEANVDLEIARYLSSRFTEDFDEV